MPKRLAVPHPSQQDAERLTIGIGELIEFPPTRERPTARDHGQHHRAQGALQLAGAAEPLIGLRKRAARPKPPTPPTIAPSAAITTGDMPLRLDGGVAERATETLCGRICSVS